MRTLPGTPLAESACGGVGGHSVGLTANSLASLSLEPSRITLPLPAFQTMTHPASRNSKTIGRVGVPLAEQAYQKLKEALIDGEYKAGEQLSVAALAAAFGVSRQPVMDAIRRLETEGLLAIVPQVGTMVTTAGLPEVRDFLHFLAFAEGQLSKLAAERATVAEIAGLIALVEAYPQADVGERETTKRYRLHNRAFHGLIHDMARSPLVHQVAIGLWDKADFYINTLYRASGFVSRETDAVEEHRRIAQAIARRDGEGSCTEIVQHILSFASLKVTGQFWV